MKQLLLKAKDLLNKGKISESLALVRKISEAIKKNMSICPNCETIVPVMLNKNDNLHAECPECKSTWGSSKVNLIKFEGNIMKKEQIISKLWSLFREGDKEILPVDINHFAATGQLRKSLADKIGVLDELQKSKELDPERLADLDFIIEKAVSKDAKEWVSSKIKFLMDKEGLSQKQAVGKAYGIARSRFSGVPVKKSDDEKETPFDLLGHIMDYEGGSLDDNGVKKLFQHIVDHKLDRTLQGHYGRTAQALINAGHIRPPKHAPKPDKDVAMKKSDEFLTKDEILNIMLNLYKNNEDPEYIHPIAIAKFESTNEIMDEAAKIVYRKAGRDFLALRKGVKAKKTEMCKEEDTPPEAGGKLKRPRSIFEAPITKKPEDKKQEKK